MFLASVPLVVLAHKDDGQWRQDQVLERENDPTGSEKGFALTQVGVGLGREVAGTDDAEGRGYDTGYVKKVEASFAEEGRRRGIVSGMSGQSWY